MERLYFLIPDVDNATQIVTALKEMGIMNECMHVIVKDLEKPEKLEMVQVLAGGVIERTDFLHALGRGLVVGGIIGMVAGLLLLVLPLEAFIIGPGTVACVTIFGSIFGAWASTLVGVAIPNPEVEKLERAVEAGGIMMLVDIPKIKEKEIMTFMHTYHPETTIQGFQLSGH
jgi:hypothetical protein